MRKWLKSIRINKNFTMSEVSRQSDITEGYYSMIENGLRSPSITTAKEIAKALNFDWTLFYSDEPSKQDKANKPPTNENT